MSPDAEPIAAAFSSGETAAVREVESWVRRAARAYRTRLGADWEDVLQDSLVELTMGLRSGSFRGEGSFRGYVWRAVNRTCIDRLRARRPDRWADLETLELEADEPSPFQRAAGEEAVLELLRLFNRLPEPCRDLFRRIVEGQSYQEMSAEIGVAAGTLRVRVLRCREQARSQRESASRTDG